MADRSAADVLLELLDKVPDATTLEILLEPEHLLTLLRAHGWSDEAIRRDLKAGGRSPGELLLAVLAKEPDTAVHLKTLGNPAAKPAAAPRRSTPATAGATATTAGAKAGARIVVGLVLALPSAWVLFVTLDVIHAPRLIVHFPGAYTLIISALVGGLLLVGSGVRGLRRPA